MKCHFGLLARRLCGRRGDMVLSSVPDCPVKPDNNKNTYGQMYEPDSLLIKQFIYNKSPASAAFSLQQPNTLQRREHESRAYRSV
jgi:hypothetical protein